MVTSLALSHVPDLGSSCMPVSLAETLFNTAPPATSEFYVSWKAAAAACKHQLVVPAANCRCNQVLGVQGC